MLHPFCTSLLILLLVFELTASLTTSLVLSQVVQLIVLLAMSLPDLYLCYMLIADRVIVVVKHVHAL